MTNETILGYVDTLNLKIEFETRRTMHALEFDYSKRQELLEPISEALVFWNLIVNLREKEWRQSDLRKLLKYYLESENEYIAILARLESMPKNLFRKVLWKFNIDFMSFESFLRRLDNTQKEKIEKIYDELFVSKKIPKVFGFLEKLFKKVTYESLMNEEAPWYLDRYSRKGMMSYDLLNLGFGFNAYPNGIKDDFILVEKSPLRFMSVKNHIDDFIVNQEFGKYWRAYKTARSNYVFFPNKDVQIKTHICPGFWYTLIVHFLFWILSPIALVFGPVIILSIWESSLNDFISFVAITPVILLAIFNPLWFMLALLKFLICNLVKTLFLDHLDTKLTNFCEKHEKKFSVIGNIFKIMYVFVIIATGIGITIFGFYLAHKFFWPSFGTLGTVIIAISIITYLIPQAVMYGNHDKLKNFSDYRWWQMLIILPSVIYLFLRFLVDYNSLVLEASKWMLLAISKIDNVLLALLSTMTKAFLDIGWINFLWLVPSSVVILLYLFLTISDKHADRIYAFQSKIFVSMGIMFLLGVVFRIYSIVGLPDGTLGFVFAFKEIVALLAIPFVFVVLLHFLINKNPAYKKAKDVLDRGKYTNSLEQGPFGTDPALILKNKWLFSLEESRQQEVVNEVLRLSFVFGGNDFSSVYSILVKGITEGKLKLLKNREKWLLKENDKLRFEVVKQVMKGKPCNKKVVENCRRSLFKRKERGERNKKILSSTGGFIVILFMPIKFIFIVLAKVFYEYPVTLYRLHDQFFNKSCPYLSESGTIKMK